MKILIIEDEYLAVQKLSKLLKEINPAIEIVGSTDGIESTVDWLEANQKPDLILMDIELSDGQSFEIFKQTLVESPVVFTTSYDEFAIQAFKVNSIDYLLKPIKKEDLERALNKFQKLNPQNSPKIDVQKLIIELQKQNQSKEYRNRFLVKSGQRLVSVEIDEIAYFYSEEGITLFVTKDKNRFIIDYTLEEIEGMLDPKFFFRVSRQFIIEIKSVSQIHNYFNGKLKLDLKPSTEKEVVVSRDRVNDFKVWMGK